MSFSLIRNSPAHIQWILGDPNSILFLPLSNSGTLNVSFSWSVRGLDWIIYIIYNRVTLHQLTGERVGPEGRWMGETVCESNSPSSGLIPRY